MACNNLNKFQEDLANCSDCSNLNYTQFIVDCFDSPSYGIYVDAMISKAISEGYELPSESTLTSLQNTLENIGDTTLQKMDVFHIYSPDIGGAIDFFTLNILDPELFQATLVNNPIAGKDGIITDGVSNYIDSGYAPINGDNYALDSASFNILISEDSSGAISYLGGSIGNFLDRVDISLFGDINRDYSNINDNFGNTIGVDITKGLKSIVRSSSTNVSRYHNGVQTGSYISPSTNVPNFSLYLGAFNNVGVPIFYTVEKTVSMFSGGALDASELTLVNLEVTNFYER